MLGPQITTIPALPGWAQLEACVDNGHIIDIIYHPVIAWRIESYVSCSEATAITAEPGLASMGILRRPDGTMFAPFDDEIANESEAKTWLEEHDDRAIASLASPQKEVV